MGTATFTISRYGANRSGIRGVLVDSGAHTTSTTASDLTDGAAGAGSAVVGQKGTCLSIRVDEDARICFGGVTATATFGQIVFANETTDLEVTASGAISVIDVA